MYARYLDRSSVEWYSQWISKIAEGAAMATRTTYKVTIITALYEYQFNRPLQEAMQKNLELVGAPAFDQADQQFARTLQRESGVAEDGLDTTVLPLTPDVKPLEGGSTDVSDVSHITPTVGLSVATVGKNLPWHGWAAAASHGTPGASRGAAVAAKVIALTGFDLLTQPSLLAQARADFTKRSGGKSYASPIPKGQKPPIPQK
jgi:aminobenzoyl-glutamate utilization protein B